MSTESTSGIFLICNKILGQFLLTENPVCTINDGKIENLRWGKEYFISLKPEIPYKITIKFPYLGNYCGTKTFNVKVKKGETQKYEYTTPFIVFSPGTINRLK